ncbi:hypothetical protein KFL_000790030 [Klebsormidium nitens]|uniref:Bud22 domain-containing protein n=1 Tax=Klebsormidium nitens TaxID=105231 RepID=A0A1Y1HZU3_KLENI|nr:hypothetical protein KFL_000790030 [Klebsormidium nitens]|eukprot:GAQ81378.1 hypothetical protein KFL_000790030 [Klebsormidium nitens]
MKGLTDDRGLPEKARKKVWQRKGGRPRLKGDSTTRKKGPASVEQETKKLRQLQLQAVKDLRQAVRNARQFEVRKVCRRIRAQEDKCKVVADKDSAAAVSLQKGLAKLGGQREALKAVNVALVLRRAIDQAEVPAELLRDSAEADALAGAGELHEWAVGRLLAAHCVTQACEKVKGEVAGQKRAIEVASARKEKKEADRQAREKEGADANGGNGGRKRKADQLVGLSEDAEDEPDNREDSSMSGEEDEGAVQDLAERALARLRQGQGRKQARLGAASSGAEASSSESDGDDQPVDDLDVSSDEGGFDGEAGPCDDVSMSGSESENEPAGVSGRSMAGKQRGSAAKPGLKKPKKKNRLGQRERKRLAAAAAPDRGRGPPRSSTGHTHKGPQKWSAASKQQERTTLAARGERTRPTALRGQSEENRNGGFSKVRPESAKVVLHPSWAAKNAAAKIIAPFAGKKVVFDEEGKKKALSSSQESIKFHDNEKDSKSSHMAKGEPVSLHPSWAAKRSQAQKLSLSGTPSSAQKIKFDD